MQWTEERTEQLRHLWLQGNTASQIAARLGGITRNAVIGKAHRLGLSSRPSPIRPPIEAAPRPAAPPTPVPAGGRGCSWPMGDPKQPGFHFCGAQAEPGRPYCAAHCAMAYHRKADVAA